MLSQLSHSQLIEVINTLKLALDESNSIRETAIKTFQVMDSRAVNLDRFIAETLSKVDVSLGTPRKSFDTIRETLQLMFPAHMKHNPMSITIDIDGGYGIRVNQQWNSPNEAEYDIELVKPGSTTFNFRDIIRDSIDFEHKYNKLLERIKNKESGRTVDNNYTFGNSLYRPSVSFPLTITPSNSPANAQYLPQFALDRAVPEDSNQAFAPPTMK